MKIFIILSVAVAVAVAAPAPGSPQLYGVKRTKKSAYGAPCGGGAPLAPIALYLAPQAQGSHYREDENTLDEQEHPSARSYYDSGAGVAGISAAGSSSSSGSLNLSPPSSSGPAVGVFPHAKVGGCAVPLLLSCAPNVVSGHIVKHSQGYASSGYGAPAIAPAYRDGEANLTEMSSKHSWSDAERSAHQHSFNSHSEGHKMHHHEDMQPTMVQEHHAHNMAHTANHNSHQVTSL